MDSRVNDCLGWDLNKCGSRKNCLGWQEAIATLSVQLDHGKLTPQNKSPGPKICSCNLLMDWVLHLVVCCTGAADQEKLVQNTRICVCEVWTSFVVQHRPSLFDCGKPLNYTLWQLWEKKEFDLPGLQTNLIKATLVFVAAIILSMAILESVSMVGFWWAWLSYERGGDAKKEKKNIVFGWWDLTSHFLFLFFKFDGVVISLCGMINNFILFHLTHQFFPSKG